jgi:hypothetical protein
VEEQDLAGECITEPAPRLDGRADDDELRAAFGGNARNVLAEASRSRADDLAPNADAVGARHGRGGLDPLLQSGERAVHVRIERQLALDDERSDEDDLRTTVGGEPAGEVERVLRLLSVEQRHDDASVADRLRPSREPPSTPPECLDVRPSHRISWYGTEARITCGSTINSRFT